MYTEESCLIGTTGREDCRVTTRKDNDVLNTVKRKHCRRKRPEGV